MGPQRWPQVLDMWETDSVRAWFAYTGTADMFEYMVTLLGETTTNIFYS